jgi:uncharacterized protein YjbI with pentapeptide repeats
MSQAAATLAGAWFALTMTRIFRQDGVRDLWVQYWPQVKELSLDAWSWVASHPNLAFSPIGAFGVLYLFRIQQDAAAATLVGAWFALTRHFAQTEADRRRRITESYSKAVTQLASDKLEERLGGIYALEGISKESPADYWTVMETLTAFVRERSRRNETERLQNFDQRVSRRAFSMWQRAGQPDGQAERHWAEAVKQEDTGEPPPTDIAAALTVIVRRKERSWHRERKEGWRLDFHEASLREADLRGAELNEADLRGADLRGAYLQDADLHRADLRGADLRGAYFQDADLRCADLEYAKLSGAHLSGANLSKAKLQFARLEGTDAPKLAGVILTSYRSDDELRQAKLTGTPLNPRKTAVFTAADLSFAYVGGVDFSFVDLRDAKFGLCDLTNTLFLGADLRGADFAAISGGLREDQLAHSKGNANTKIPGLIRPAHWSNTGQS